MNKVLWVVLLVLCSAGAALGKTPVPVTVTLSGGASSLQVYPGQQVLVTISVGETPADIRALALGLDLSQKSKNAPDLAGRPADLGVVARWGSIFTLAGSETAELLAHLTNSGQIRVSGEYRNSARPAQGPGTLVTVPLIVPGDAPAGASWTVRLAGDGSGPAVALTGPEGPIPAAASGSVTLTVSSLPPPPPPVDKTPPRVAIYSPATDALVAKDLWVQIDAADDGRAVWKVELQATDVPGFVLRDYQEPFRFLIERGQLPDGVHTLVATAMDLAGNTAASEPITVVVDTRGPSILLPGAAGDLYLADSAEVVVDARDGVSGITKVGLFIDASLSSAQSLTAPNAEGKYRFTIPAASLEEGSHSMAVSAADRAGNSSMLGVRLHVDRTPPTALITSPQALEVVRGRVAVKGSALDDTLDSNSLASYVLEAGQGQSPASFTRIASVFSPVQEGVLGQWDTSRLEPGLYTLRLTATDKAGHEVRHSVPVTVERGVTGDLDGNGVLSVLDVLALLKGLAGLNPLTDAQLALADVDQNGRVDVRDAMRMLKLIAGLS